MSLACSHFIIPTAILASDLHGQRMRWRLNRFAAAATWLDCECSHIRFSPGVPKPSNHIEVPPAGFGTASLTA